MIEKLKSRYEGNKSGINIDLQINGYQYQNGCRHTVIDQQIYWSNIRKNYGVVDDAKTFICAFCNTKDI